MSNLCQQTRAINIGSNLQNAGLVRSLLGQLMPLVHGIRLSYNNPWSTPLASGSAEGNEVLDSFRLELINALDNCIAAVKEKMRVFQKRVMRKTTTPIKASPVPSANIQGSPATISPRLSPGMPRFRSELQLSQDVIIPKPTISSPKAAEKTPSSHPLSLPFILFLPNLPPRTPVIIISQVMVRRQTFY